MPTEKELLALCLKWLQNPRKLGAFDRAMLIEAVQAKLEPRPWVGLTAEEAAQCWATSATKTWQAIEQALKEKNQ
jgi:hypothetical protein